MKSKKEKGKSKKGKRKWFWVTFAFCLLPFYFLQAQPYRLRVDSLRVDYKFYVGATDRFPFFGYLNSNNRVTSTTIEDGAIQNVDITNPNITFSAGEGLYGSGGQIDLGGSILFQVNVDNTSIEINNDTLRVKAGGVTNAMLENSSLGISAGSGLSGGGTPNLGESVALNVTVDDSSIYINNDTLKVRVNSAGGIIYIDTLSNQYALSFDDANSEFASVATTAVSDQTGFFSFWIIVDDFDTFYFPVGFGRTDLATTFVRVDTRTTGKVYITQRNGDTQDQVSSSSTLTIGQKHHIICGSNGSNFLMWIDGNSQTLSVIGGSNNGDWIGDLTQSGTSQAYGIGAKPGNPYAGFLPGDMDEIVYSSTTPTQAIATDIYNEGQPKDETNNALYTTVHYWRLEEGSGQTAEDSKGSLDMTLGTTGGEEASDPTWISTPFGWEHPGLKLSIDADFFAINATNQLTIKDSAITNVQLKDSSFDLNTGGGIGGGDTISLGGSDSIYVEDGGITTAKLADSSVTWEKLSALLRANIGGNLYDYQDATINTNLQMHVRKAHYMFEKYYSETDYYYHFDYDLTGAEYKKTRRPLISYIDLLVALHKETGRAIYWTRLTDLAAVLLTDMNTINHAVTGGRSCKSIRLEETSPSVYFDTWSYADCHFFSALYYIYTQNTTAYASYLTEVKNFIDVSRSYITKSGIEGWGMDFHWDEGPATNSTTRVNVNGAWLPFWAEMKANNITTTDITTTASYDSLLDSTYAFIMSAWEVESWYSGAVPTGGWGIYVNSTEIELRYVKTIFVDFCRTSEILNDWSSWSETGMKDSLAKVLNYCFTTLSGNWKELNKAQNPALALMVKWAQAESITLPDTVFSLRTSSAAVTDYLNPCNFGGANWLIGGNPRYDIDRLGKWTANMITYFNDNAFSETYLFPYVFRRNVNLSSTYYFNDGFASIDQYECGVNTSLDLRVGYRHDDSSPNIDTTDFVLSNLILSYPAPTSGTMSNGLTYSITHKMGSPYKKVVPSAADSIWFRVFDTGDNNGDSTYIFYYTPAGVLDTLRNTELAVDDSILVDGTKGIIANIVRVTAPGDGDHCIGFICNKSSLYLVARDETSPYKKYVTSVTTLPDSAIFFYFDHSIENFGLNDASDFTGAFQLAREILENLQDVWNNGLGYDGILENKTQ